MFRLFDLIYEKVEEIDAAKYLNVTKNCNFEVLRFHFLMVDKNKFVFEDNYFTIFRGEIPTLLDKRSVTDVFYLSLHTNFKEIFVFYNRDRNFYVFTSS